MGNRAIVAFTDGKSVSSCVYLHWNGGPESIYAFVNELDRREVRADGCYEVARFVQIIGEFFDSDSRGSLSLGICDPPAYQGDRAYRELAEGQDNGFFLINRAAREEGQKMPVIRRFIHRADKPHEMKPEDVMKEWERAIKHPYNQGEESLERFFVNLDQKLYGEAA